MIEEYIIILLSVYLFVSSGSSPRLTTTLFAWFVPMPMHLNLLFFYNEEETEIKNNLQNKSAKKNVYYILPFETYMPPKIIFKSTN